MKSLSATAQIERAGIERAIRECDYLLELISERRVGLAIELNESHLIRHLLAIRRSYPRTCAGSRVTARRPGAPQATDGLVSAPPAVATGP